MTTIGIFSDIHIDFQYWDFKKEPGIFYINAGDVAHNHMLRDKFYFDHPEVFTVYGNHDYYGKFGVPFKSAPNHMFQMQHKDLHIKGATLWTHLENDYEFLQYSRCLIDHANTEDMTYELYKEAHEKHKKFLFEGDYADILVMHHAPSYYSVDQTRFAGDPANKFFATELFETILKMPKKPKLIIHGHMHNPSDYMIGETRVICHPRGYPGERTYYNDYEPRILEV